MFVRSFVKIGKLFRHLKRVAHRQPKVHTDRNISRTLRTPRAYFEKWSMFQPFCCIWFL